MNSLEETTDKTEKIEVILLQILTCIVTVCFLVNIVYTMTYNGNREKITEPNKSNVSLPVPVPPPDPDAVITKAILDHSLVEINKCTANGSEMIVRGTITNQGVDGELKICAACMSDSAIRLYDDAGNRITCNLLEVGSVKDRLSVNFKFISGVKVPITMRFTVPTIGGQTQAKKSCVVRNLC